MEQEKTSRDAVGAAPVAARLSLRVRSENQGPKVARLGASAFGCGSRRPPVKMMCTIFIFRGLS